MRQPTSEPQQIALPFGQDEEALRLFFCAQTGREVSLTITDNATSMISFRKAREALFLRLHRIFMAAGGDVLREITVFINKRGTRTPLIREYIKAHATGLKSSRPRKVKTRTMGKHHDLLKIFQSVNAEYFGGRIEALITWGTGKTRTAAQRRTLGSYSSRTGMIRIHPLLDRRCVPAFFVEFIVYHEMLHADMGCSGKAGKRRSVHPREFRERERLFRHYERAISWENHFFSGKSVREMSRA